MRFNRKILEFERQAASLSAKDYFKYFAFEERRSRRSTLLIQSFAIFAVAMPLLINPRPAGGEASVLIGLASAMVLCGILGAVSRHYLMGALARISFVVLCSEYLTILCQSSPHATLWRICISAILMIVVSPIHYDPMSYLVTAVVVALNMTRPLQPELGMNIERDWQNCLLASAFGFGSLMNLSFFLTRTRYYSVNRQLAELAFKDGLTRINNRRAFMGEWEQQRLTGDSGGLYLLLIDADDFKKINDEHGHDAGDLVLQAIASILQGLRGVESCGRLGGEEFGVLVRGSAAEAAAIARNINMQVSAARVHHIRFTVSIGIAAQRLNETLGDVMRRADQALYDAKRLGKNTYCLNTECSHQ